MPVKVNSSEFAEKWNRRIKQATQDVVAGASKVTDSPGKRAASKKSKWAARMSSPEIHEKWARNIGSVTVDDWRASIIEVGVPRIAAGADRAQRKVADFAEKLITYQNAGLPKIDAMPDMTLEDSKARAVAWIEYMSKFKR